MNTEKGKDKHSDTSYKIVPTTESSLDSESLEKPGRECESKCRKILRNKCCIVCLVLLVLLFMIAIGGKIAISELLKADKFEAEHLIFYTKGNSSELELVEHGNSTLNGTETTTHFIDLDTWEAPAEIHNEVVYYMSGHDRENNPVWVIPYGIWDLKKLLTAGTDEENENNLRDLHIYFDQFNHRCQKSARDSGTGKWTLLGDMDRFGYGQLWSWTTTSFMLKLAKKFENNLDTIESGFILNLDMVSKAFVSLMKPVLGAMLERLEPFGSDKEHFSKFILEKIDAGQFPEIYGGTGQTDPRHAKLLSAGWW